MNSARSRGDSPNIAVEAWAGSLLAAVEEKARALGCTKVTLEVLEANPARKLYEAMGYASPVYYKARARHSS